VPVNPEEHEHKVSICASCGGAPSYPADRMLGLCLPCFWRSRNPTALDQSYELEENPVAPMPRRLREAAEASVSKLIEILGHLNDSTNQITAEMKSIHALPEKTPEDLGRFVGLRMALQRNLEALDVLTAYPETFAPVFPANPVKSYCTAVQKGVDYTTWFKPNRIYLDVTDATRKEVDERWTEVEWAQKELRERGESKKRSRGTPQGPRAGGEVERWNLVAKNIGLQRAFLEFKTEKNRTDRYTPADYRWWYRHIRPHFVQKSR